MASTLRIDRTIRGLSGNSYRLSSLLQKREDISDEVWLATGDNGRSYVVKTLSPSFMREACTTLKAFEGSPFIRQPVEEGEVEHTGKPAFVFDYLDADLLSLSKKGKLDISVVKTFIKAILRALAFIHGHNYIHLDVKLNNVLFNFIPGTSRVGDIKLGDCETATLLGESIQPAVLGAPMFCAPEVFLGQDVGPTSDIWSLGVVLISLLLGPNQHIFRPPGGTPDDEYRLAVLQRQEMFFGPWPETFMQRVGEEIATGLRAISIGEENRRPFKYFTAGGRIAPADVEFVYKIMRLDPLERPTAEQLLKDPWF